jgi:hypothetical protein
MRLAVGRDGGIRIGLNCVGRVPGKSGLFVFAAVFEVKLGFHHDEGDFALVLDEVEDALDARFLDLPGLALEEFGEVLDVGADLGPESAVVAGAVGLDEESNGFADEVGEGFAAIALETQGIEQAALLGCDTDAELVTFTVVGAHGG